jgi:hypothetical protein
MGQFLTANLGRSWTPRAAPPPAGCSGAVRAAGYRQARLDSLGLTRGSRRRPPRVLAEAARGRRGSSRRRRASLSIERWRAGEATTAQMCRHTSRPSKSDPSVSVHGPGMRGGKGVAEARAIARLRFGRGLEGGLDVYRLNEFRGTGEGEASGRRTQPAVGPIPEAFFGKTVAIVLSSG